MNPRTDPEVVAAVIRIWEADAGMPWPGAEPPPEGTDGSYYAQLYRHARAVLAHLPPQENPR